MGWSDGNRGSVIGCGGGGGGGVAAAVVVIVEGEHCCLSCGTSGSVDVVVALRQSGRWSYVCRRG